MLVDPTGVKVTVKFGDQTVLEICDGLTLLPTTTTTMTPADGPYDNRAKRQTRFCLKNRSVGRSVGFALLQALSLTTARGYATEGKLRGT